MKCSYGCGQDAEYTLSGKYCCSDNWRKCPAVRQKNSEGLKIAHSEGRLNADHLHLPGVNDWRKGKTSLSDNRIRGKYKNQESLFSKNTVGACYIRKALLDLKIVENKCAICGLTDWLNKPIVFDLDHIDGDRFNNTKENVRLLCPNCHSQTETFRGRNVKRPGKKIEDEVLIDALNKTKSIRQALLICGLSPRGGNYIRAKRLQSEYCPGGGTADASDSNKGSIQKEFCMSNLPNSANSEMTTPSQTSE